MKTRLLILTILFAGIAANPANAQVRVREHRQNERIRQGIRNGELTRAEARRLKYEQRDIRQDIYHARVNDGRIGPAERAHIRRDERIASLDIYRAKHNSRSRY